MKKIFTSMALLLCASVSSVWAGDTFTLSLDNAATETRSDESTDKYFTVAGSYNSKYTGTYNGKSYKKGLKINSEGSVTFTTTTTSTLTYVQSLSDDKTKSNATGLKNSSGTDLISTTDSRVDDETNKVGVYTYSSLPAGTYTIYYGSNAKETGLLYVSVVYDDKAENALDNPTLTLTDSEEGVVTIGIPENALYVAFTTDGTAPSEESGKQLTSESTIIVTDGTIVKAIAIGDGTNYTNSDIESLKVSLTGFQVAQPTITSWNGLVKMVTDTEDAVIYYTTDGSTPSTNSTKYTGIVYLESDATINAIATRDNCTDSEVANASVIGMPVASGVAINGASSGFGDGGNKVTLTIDDLTYTLQITSNTSKSLSAQGKVNGATGIKLSNGATNTLTLPEGYVATKITFYSFVNANDPTEKASGWKEVGGTSYSDYSSFPMAATSGSYDIRTYELNKLNAITFTNAGTQLIFTIALDIEKESTEGKEITAAYKYTTHCYDVALDFSNLDVKAYYVSEVSSTQATLATFENNIVPAETGFIIQNDNYETASTITVPEASTEGTSVVNKLVGVLKDQTLDATSGDATNYILYDGEFVPTSGGTIKAGKAYLPIESSSSAKLAIVFEGATGINEVNAAANNGKIYNLQGIEVKNADKGLFIKDGKKFMK